MTTTTTDERYISVREAARRANVTYETTLRWMGEGRIVWRKKNLREKEINERLFDEFLEELRAPIPVTNPNPLRRPEISEPSSTLQSTA